MRTQASIPYSFGKSKFIMLSIFIIFQDSLSFFLLCRYVTLRSSISILVPERGTPILILSWYRNVAPDPYSILVSERDTPILIFILSWYRNVAPDPLIHQAFFYTKASLFSLYNISSLLSY